ncbi:tetratricopeptide repeat protein [Fulvivirgaceae bacterium PWU5]|uniref:Tetratricopeptide repeat protein n=1 Tax=Dawidia cretensis TaxID=2782350 RepID=A0AAP2E5M5_9BACT|nr:tetratricopeptide repeat protein [Dawidia cretensis]MBT1712354.1 tetratricopeptide repeat protein [Dawidia cretensis]
MSLIVCRQHAGELMIVSDTKLTYPSDLYPNKQTGNPGDGVIKTVIINPTTCISFAGEIAPAEEVIKTIDASDNLSVLKSKLAHYASGETDFILCTLTPEVEIFEIKNGIAVKVQSSWIGSAHAFNRFQGYYLNNLPEKHQAGSFMRMEMSPTNGSTKLSGLAAAFDRVIDDEEVPEVGGFRVAVILDNNTFQYQSYVHTYRANITITIDPRHPNQIIPITHGTASEGAYMVNFFGTREKTNSHIAVHIHQANLGLMYARIDGGLPRPTFYKMDEVDFVEFIKSNFGVGPALTTQSKAQKLLEQANIHFHARDFERAMTCFEQLLIIDKGKIRARAQYSKGICLLNLQRLQEGIIEIQAAIDLDPSLRTQAISIIPKILKAMAARTTDGS